MSLTLHTTLGDLKIELSPLTPTLSANFLALAASGAYDGTLFHRVVAGFIAQGGAPAGSGGRGGAAAGGGTLPDEFAPALRHAGRGTLSMAKRDAARDGNGAQFFIALAPAPHLDGASCVIGAVIGGAAVLDALEAVPVAGKAFRPVADVAVTRVTIHANPFAAPPRA